MITILYNLTFSIKSCFSQTDSGKPFKLKFPSAPYTPPSGFKICKGSCKPKFIWTQRFQVTEAGGEIRALQWSEFSIYQTLTLHESQLCSQRTRQRKKKRQYLANYRHENHDSERNEENILDPNIQLSHLKEAIQLRFIREFPVTFPLTSLVFKNEYHLTVQSLEKDIIILSAEKHNWPSM